MAATESAGAVTALVALFGVNAFGESAYILLSLTAKTALAWHVFANVLV